jgi:hypothetical protein
MGKVLEHFWWERTEELVVKYSHHCRMWWWWSVPQTLGICSGCSSYLRPSGKADGVLVPVGAVIWCCPCPPGAVSVIAQVAWAVRVFFIIGVEMSDNVILFSTQGLGPPRCFFSDP